MKTIFLRINLRGHCQPHQCADGSNYAIHNCPDNVSAANVAMVANKTVIAAPYSLKPLPIEFTELDHHRTGKWINVYWEIKHGHNRLNNQCL